MMGDSLGSAGRISHQTVAGVKPRDYVRTGCLLIPENSDSRGQRLATQWSETGGQWTKSLPIPGAGPDIHQYMTALVSRGTYCPGHAVLLVSIACHVLLSPNRTPPAVIAVRSEMESG